MNLIVKYLAFFIQFLTIVEAANSEDWRKRTVYQVLVDRFARSPGAAVATADGCDDLKKYCGGTWQGLSSNLDYIADMGFDAIWISPIVKNSKDGYHGYWTTDWEGVNEHFGTEEDLHNLVKTAHSKGMYVMVDVVANHVAYVSDENNKVEDFGLINPFNKAEYYHDDCEITDYDDPWQMENCRLCGLPDLK